MAASNEEKIMPTILPAVRGLVFGLAAAIVLAQQAGAADSLRPGQWEVTTTGTMTQEGQTQDLPADVVEMCLSPEQAQAAVTAAPPGDSGCSVATISQGAGTLVTRVTCGENVMDSTMTWQDDSYESVSHMVMASEGKVMMTSDMVARGRYVGACTP